MEKKNEKRKNKKASLFPILIFMALLLKGNPLPSNLYTRQLIHWTLLQLRIRKTEVQQSLSSRTQLFATMMAEDTFMIQFPNRNTRYNRIICECTDGSAIFRLIEIRNLCNRCEKQPRSSTSACKTVVDRLTV